MNQKNVPFLIVDDEPEMCWILEIILGKKGLPCLKAGNAREAITLMEKQSFRMAFLDAKLPDFDGLKLARMLRKFDPNLPIAIVSGYFYQDDPTIRKAIQKGLINVFVSKPFLHDEIERVIARYAPR